MASSIVIAGYSSSDKVPGYYAESVFGAGPINISSISLVLLLVGLKATSGGSATADVDVLQVTSKDDADTFFGAGSELARQCYTAIDEGRGFKLLATSPAFAGGAVAASATITYVGTASSAGTFRYYLNGVYVEVNVQSGDLIGAIATNAAAAFNKASNGRLCATASAALGVVTLTHKSKGIRGNDAIIYQDITLAPGTTTSTLAGGAATTSSSLVNGCRFTSGSGVETLTTTLSNLFPGRYNRIAVAQNDATSLAAWLTQINSKAGVLEGRMEHVIVGHSGTSAAATSVAQTTLNNARFQLVWLKDSETHPSELAAGMAAVRASVEGSAPNSGYDGFQFATFAPQRFQSDWANRTTQQSCLDNSVTPLVSVSNGVQCVRAITTHSLNGTTPDYRTIDTAQSVVTDFVRDDLKIFWTTGFVKDNPYVTAQPADTDPEPPPGVATPGLWNSAVYARLLDHQKARILTQVARNPPASSYDDAANRIMSAVPVVALPLQHAIGVSVRQLNVTA